MKNIIITNHKGGASKSTTTMQIAEAYGINKGLKGKVENSQSAVAMYNFGKKIKTRISR